MTHTTLAAPTHIEALIARGLVWNSETQQCAQHSFDTERDTRTAIPFGIPEIDTALPCGGLQCGAIHEMFYNDNLQPHAVPSTIPALVSFNAYRSHTQNSWTLSAPLTNILWIGKRCWPTPYTLSFLASRAPSNLSSFIQSSLFIDPPTEKLTLWAIETALRSQAVRLVIAACPDISLVTTKRLSLAAHTHNTTAILLRHRRSHERSSCAVTKWLITPAPSPYDMPAWNISLTKIRGNSLHEPSWLVGIYEKDSNVSLRVLPRVVDRGHETEVARKEYGT